MRESTATAASTPAPHAAARQAGAADGTDKTRSAMSIRIRGDIHDVWREITRTFNMRMHYDMLQPGSKFSMRSANGKYTGVVGEILEVRPPTRFAHTFRFTNLDDPPCKVIYELKDVGGGEVEFTLALEDLTPGTKSAKQMVGGAKLIAGTLKSVIETGRPGFGTRMLFLVIWAMTPFTPKRCLTKNWV